jgi:hypothetical protein
MADIHADKQTVFEVHIFRILIIGSVLSKLEKNK